MKSASAFVAVLPLPTAAMFARARTADPSRQTIDRRVVRTSAVASIPTRA